MVQEKEPVKFTSEMKQTYTILAPMMLPVHFGLFVDLLAEEGYHVEVLNSTSQQVIDQGLEYVHNDICYPCLLVIGQMIEALKSGKYDVNKTALMITQTGGGCRASNYIYLLRKALINSGFEQVPVISLNLANMDKGSSFRFTPGLLLKASFAILYGDMLMWIANQCKPYEKKKGDTNRLLKHWNDRLCVAFKTGDYVHVKRNYMAILQDFAKIERELKPRVKVGIVGEIYMKYSPLGNNDLEEFLINEGAEPVVSGLMDFMLYGISNRFHDKALYGKRSMLDLPVKAAVAYLVKRQNQMIEVIKKHGVFTPPSKFSDLEELVAGYINQGAKMGEGWLLTAEILELLHSGVPNIVCTQPFGCLPNHIVAKGMMRKIKDLNPSANIVAIDYDPSATKINQENRLKLMLANAHMTQGPMGQPQPNAASAAAQEIYV